MREQKESVIRVFDDLALRRSWERLYSGNVNRIKYNYMTRLRAVEELIGSYVTGNILDIGCGTGDLAPFIIEQETTYYGVDLSSKMIERAKSNYGVFLRNGRATFHVADCENLHFCSKKFDMVIAIALIEYLPDPIKFMIEAQRVLKDGGYFLITVPYKECINSKIRECLFPITKILFPIYVKLINQPLLRMVDVKHFSSRTFCFHDLISSANFSSFISIELLPLR